MKSIRTLRFLLTLLCISHPSFTTVVSAVSYKFDSKHATCTGNPFSDDDVYLAATCSTSISCTNNVGGSCSKTSACEWGDTPKFSGRLVATDVFMNSQVVVEPCFGRFCMKRDRKVDGRVCNWIKPIDGQSCGEIGTYQFDHSMQLPNQNSIPKKWMLNSLVVKIHIQAATGCPKFWNRAKGYELPYPTMGMAFMVGVAVALLRHRAKKRRRRRENESEEDSEMGSQTEYTSDDGTMTTMDDDGSYVEMGSTTTISDYGQEVLGLPAPEVVRHHRHRPNNLPSSNLSNLTEDGSSAEVAAAHYQYHPRQDQLRHANLTEEGPMRQLPAVAAAAQYYHPPQPQHVESIPQHPMNKPSLSHPRNDHDNYRPPVDQTSPSQIGNSQTGRSVNPSRNPARSSRMAVGTTTGRLTSPSSVRKVRVGTLLREEGRPAAVTTRQHPRPNKKIPLEVLRQMCENQGIAIV